MKTFQYSGFDRDGRPKTGVLEAADPKEARVMLTRQGIMPERLSEAQSGETRGSRPLKAGERAIFYRELATLLRAGVPMLGAMQTILSMPEFERPRIRLAAARDRIREGAGLGEALAKAEAGLDSFEGAALEAGMRAGMLDESLDRLAGYLQEQQELRAKISSALTYPAVVLGFAVVVAVVMMGFVLPSALALIQRSGSGVEMPLITRMMLKLREIGIWLLPLVIVLGAGTAWLFRWRWRGDADFRVAADRLLFRVPWVGRSRLLLVNLRFARTFAMVLRGGVAAEEGLAIAGRASGSAWVERLAAEEGEAVRHGSSLSDAVRRIPPLADYLPSWIQTGEAAGSLAEMLDHAAGRVQNQWNRQTARLLALLEPALILLVGGLVFLVAMSIILPLIRMNSGLLD